MTTMLLINQLKNRKSSKVMNSSQSDKGKLYEELKSAIDQDKMYWIKNDAKIRAAVTSKSYDEFREIVAAAHLQPLTKEDKEKKQRNWNSLGSN